MEIAKLLGLQFWTAIAVAMLAYQYPYGIMPVMILVE
jgi:hypothetical protein